MLQAAVTGSSNPLLRWWNNIINIGITPDTSLFDRKRTRLINGIGTWAMLVFSMYIIRYAVSSEGNYIFWESVVAMLGYSFPIVLNRYGKHTEACHAFNVFNLFFYLFLAVTGGGYDGAEYIFITNSVASMLFFKEKNIVLYYFLANLAFFFIGKWAQLNIEPLFTYSGQKYVYIANHVTVFVILFLIISYFRSENALQEQLLNERNQNLSLEKQKSDSLLLNILPHETAEELKQTGTAKSRSFDNVTVMFTDFRHFTAAAERMSPTELVNEIHDYFSMFDQITSKYNIEKIKTIGDSYMCAGGIPQTNHTHPVDVVSAALEIQAYMQQKKEELESKGKLFFELRLGIHTGPVVAGIVGTKKFAYDIWGDTVNVASRMESSGTVGKVNISGTTYELIKDKFICEYRGKVQAKNKGEVDMYYVEGHK